MFCFANAAACAAAALTLVGASLLPPAVAPAAAVEAPVLVAQAGSAPSGTGSATVTPKPSATAKKAPATVTPKRNTADRVEARINELHSRLKITEAQSPQWNSFAQVMRDNAQAMRTMLDERVRDANTMSAVENLRTYQAITQAHADGLAKLVTAFEALYGSMSPEQKKNADVVLGSFGRRQASAKSGQPASPPKK